MSTATQTSTQNKADTHAYLTLRLADEVFALDVQRVREVLEVPHITKVPHAPATMRGVINLRGKVLPVIDTRLRFGLESKPDTRETSIIVIEVSDEESAEKTLIGAVVDQALQVQEINMSSLEPAPSLGTAYRAEFVTGVAKQNERFILLLDMDKVFSLSELKSIEQLSTQQTLNVTDDQAADSDAKDSE